MHEGEGLKEALALISFYHFLLDEHTPPLCLFFFSPPLFVHVSSFFLLLYLPSLSLCPYFLISLFLKGAMCCILKPLDQCFSAFLVPN